MSLMVSDQRLVMNQANRVQFSVRERIRAAAGSGKSFRNCISRLNRLAKQVTDKLDHKNDKKIKHLTKKQEGGIIHTNNGEMVLILIIVLSPYTLASPFIKKAVKATQLQKKRSEKGGQKKSP